MWILEDVFDRAVNSGRISKTNNVFNILQYNYFGKQDALVQTDNCNANGTNYKYNVTLVNPDKTTTIYALFVVSYVAKTNFQNVLLQSQLR